MSQDIKGSYHAPRHFRETGVTNTVICAFQGASELTGWNIVNTNSTEVYLKFCDVTSGTTVVGTSPVVLTLFIPAYGTTVLSAARNHPIMYFNNAITFYCVTGVEDSNTAAPTTAVTVSIMFRKSELT